MIYLISTGCYSDYCVCGYFTDREQAEEYCRLMNAGDNYYHDEYYVEELEEINLVEELANIHYFYKVKINLNGVVDSLSCEPTLDEIYDSIDFLENEFSGGESSLKICFVRPWQDKDRMVKICRDILAEFKEMTIDNQEHDEVCEALEKKYYRE